MLRFAHAAVEERRFRDECARLLPEQRVEEHDSTRIASDDTTFSDSAHTGLRLTETSGCGGNYVT